MADNGRWFKLWITAPYDPHLSNLSLEDFARWCLFGIYLKTHGNNGVIEITSPAIAIQQLFRVQNYDEVVQIIKRFPSCIFTVTHVTTATVTWRNWLKYQGDFSGDRVRKFRDVKRTKKRGEERRREEKRKEENNTPVVPLKGDVEIIISHLNLILGTNYKPDTKETIALIQARLKKGFTVADFKTVIEKKFIEWGSDSKMVTFLRPETLFGTKFEAYLNQVMVKPKPKTALGIAMQMWEDEENDDSGSGQIIDIPCNSIPKL